ncbi:hypothetical protein [uncultured Aquimarina sp.]|uniref:hypothetical protein n=1 Tax=uncultured Aquimarina sp. TaxID=575652 RepID=UPI00260292FA|nr:hypothetical protein [uncultured Aquimarina sp.]
MTKYYDLGFAEVEILEDYFKSTIKEGFVQIPSRNKLLLELAAKHFNNKPFVYTSNNIITYSINPKIYH